MKKSTSLLLSGILVSGMVLGTVVTPATVVNAADDASEQAATVVNLVKVVDENGNAISDIPVFSVTGTEKSSIDAAVNKELAKHPISATDTTAASKYVVDPNQKAVFIGTGSTQTLKVYDNAKTATGTVSYVDSATNTTVPDLSSSVTGYIGQKVKVETPAAIKENSQYSLSDSNATITLLEGKNKYVVYVTKNVSNTVIFKTTDGDQISTATITGKKVGDTVDVTSQLPAGYTADNAKVTLQANGNTQIVTVKKTADGITPFKSTVETKSDSAFIPLYTSTGKSALRGLAAGTDWATNNKMILDGVTYYQVSTTEFVKASDVTVKGNVDTSTDTNTDTNTDAVASDKSTVTTKNVAFTPLYTKDGKLIGDRGLGANSPWHSDLMITVNGIKMYRVATNE